MKNECKRKCSAILLGIIGCLALLLGTEIITFHFDSKFITSVYSHKDMIVWSVASTWLGIAAWLWNTRPDNTEGFWKIICYYYIFMAIVISSVVFSISYRFDPTFKIGFYSTSFSLGLVLGFLVANFWKLVENLMPKVKLKKKD